MDAPIAPALKGLTVRPQRRKASKMGRPRMTAPPAIPATWPHAGLLQPVATAGSGPAHRWGAVAEKLRQPTLHRTPGGVPLEKAVLRVGAPGPR